MLFFCKEKLMFCQKKFKNGLSLNACHVWVAHSIFGGETLAEHMQKNYHFFFVCFFEVPPPKIS